MGTVGPPRKTDPAWPAGDAPGLEWFLYRIDALLYDVLAVPSPLVAPGLYEVTRRAFIEVRGTYENVVRTIGESGPASRTPGEEPTSKTPQKGPAWPYEGTSLGEAIAALRAPPDNPPLRLKEHGLEEGSAQLARKLQGFTQPYEEYFALGGRASANPRFERLKALWQPFKAATKAANYILGSMGSAGVPGVGAFKEVKDGVELAVDLAAPLWGRMAGRTAPSEEGRGGLELP